jgi:hypothetical protein
MELSKLWINIISSTPPWSQAPPPLPLGGSAQTRAIIDSRFHGGRFETPQQPHAEREREETSPTKVRFDGLSSTYLSTTWTKVIYPIRMDGMQAINFLSG